MAKAARHAVTAPARRGSAWLLCTAAMLPVAVPFLLWDTDVYRTFDASAALLGLCALVACAGLVISRGYDRLVLSRTLIGWTAFLAWLAVSGALSGRPWASFVGETTNALGWASLVCATIIALSVQTDTAAVIVALRRFAPWLVTAQVLVVVAQLLADRAARGTLPNSSYLGEALLLTLPWTLADPVHSDARRRVVGLAVAALGVAALAASGARVAFVVAAVWFGWAVLRDTRLPTVQRRAVVFGAVAVAALLAVIFAGGELASVLGPSAFGDRPAMWRLAAAGIADRPLAGWGADGFLAAGARNMTVEMAHTGTVLTFGPAAVDPHNVVLWVALSSGLIGLVLFAWPAIEWIRALTRAHGCAEDRIPPAVWSLGGIAVVAATAPVAVQVLPLIGLVAGAGVVAVREPMKIPRPVARAMLALSAVVAVLLTANGLTRMPYERPSAETSARLAAGAERAATVWRFDGRLAQLASDHWAYTLAGQPVSADARRDLVWAERAVRLDAHDPNYAFALARTLRYYGLPAAEVDAAFGEVFERWPTFPMAAAEYAGYLAEQGRDVEARERLATVALMGEPTEGTAAAVRYAEGLLAE